MSWVREKIESPVNVRGPAGETRCRQIAGQRDCIAIKTAANLYGRETHSFVIPPGRATGVTQIRSPGSPASVRLPSLFDGKATTVRVAQSTQSRRSSKRDRRVTRSRRQMNLTFVPHSKHGSKWTPFQVGEELPSDQFARVPP